MLSNETLVRKAHTAYGELITKIDLYSQGIHVHLVGSRVRHLWGTTGLSMSLGGRIRMAPSTLDALTSSKVTARHREGAELEFQISFRPFSVIGQSPVRDPSSSLASLMSWTSSSSLISDISLAVEAAGSAPSSPSTGLALVPTTSPDSL